MTVRYAMLLFMQYVATSDDREAVVQARSVFSRGGFAARRYHKCCVSLRSLMNTSNNADKSRQSRATEERSSTLRQLSHRLVGYCMDPNAKKVKLNTCNRLKFSQANPGMTCDHCDVVPGV